MRILKLGYHLVSPSSNLEVLLMQLLIIPDGASRFILVKIFRYFSIDVKVEEENECQFLSGVQKHINFPELMHSHFENLDVLNLFY